MKPAPHGKAEPDGIYPMPLHGWTCFHCGETFSIAKQGCADAATAAAREHFGPDPRWTPLCVEMNTVPPRKLWRRMRLAEIALASQPELREQVEFLSGVCGDRDKLRNLLDSTKGELLVLKEHLES